MTDGEILEMLSRRTYDEIMLQIAKNKNSYLSFMKVAKRVKKMTKDDREILVARYAANGFYESDYPGVYKQWSRIWYRDYYLQSPHWYKFRSYILNRHDGKCELCKRSAIRLDIHHRSYENLFIEKRKDVLIICRDCHSKIHPE